MSTMNLTAYANFQDRPGIAGKIFDRTDQDGHSGVPQGGPAPYGRVLVRGLGGHSSTNVDLNLTDKYYTKSDTVSLPDVDGAYLRDRDLDQTYADAGLALPVNGDGDLIYAGIGMWTEYNAVLNNPLEQPFGLGEHFYQAERCGQVGMAIEGNIWAYCETDINVGDDLLFRTVVSAPTDGIQLLGGFASAQAVPAPVLAEFQAFPFGSVFRPGPAGGIFVLNLNIQK